MAQIINELVFFVKGIGVCALVYAKGSRQFPNSTFYIMDLFAHEFRHSQTCKTLALLDQSRNGNDDI
jgi:hypothetical protein